MRLLARLLAAPALLLSVGTAAAQFGPGGGEIPGLDQAMRSLFEKVDGFTATARMKIGSGGQDVTLSVAMSMLDGDMRSEVDLSKMEGGGIPAEMMGQLKAAGMDRSVTIGYANTGRTLMIYPGMKSYAELNPGRAAGEKAPECKFEKTVLGNEDVAGKACEKRSVKVTCEGASPVTLTVWADKANKELPAKIAMNQEGVAMTMEFMEFKEMKPDAALFTEPKDFKKHASMQELMMANMQKLMQAAPQK